MSTRWLVVLLAVTLVLIAGPASAQSPSPSPTLDATPSPTAPPGMGITRAAVMELLSEADVAVSFADVAPEVDIVHGTDATDVELTLEGPADDILTIHIGGGAQATPTLGMILEAFAHADAADDVDLDEATRRLLAGEVVRVGRAVEPFWLNMTADVDAGTIDATLVGRPSTSAREAAVRATPGPRPTPTPQPTPTPEPKPGYLREPALVGDGLRGWGWVVPHWFRKLDRCAYTKPKRNHVYLAVGVGYAAGDDGMSYGVSDWVAYDKKGRQYEISFAFDCYDEMLDSGYLGSGRQTSGIVMFEVPKKAKGLKIAYRPSLFDADEVTWRLRKKPKK